MTLNKQQQGEINRLRVLLYISRVGYASLKQIARAIWQRTDASALVMTGRTLKWLTEEKYIVTRRDTIKSELLVTLTKKSVRWLAERDFTLPDHWKHARDWLRHAHAHRTACNSVYACLYSGDFSQPGVWSELEIGARVSPIFQQTYEKQENAFVLKEIHTKIPDVIAESATGFEWIEVENCSRSEADFEKLIMAMRAMRFANDRQISNVHCIIASTAAERFSTRLKAYLVDGLGAFSPAQQQLNQ
ncbi:hypothetical protein [uncultured Deefgea sp.]|uniref:hypothetical protein n=1 Tax=uncultured Deefgea sp. TaxID=1304914 RepID=UPI0026230038|nr:hypothetical protein [uncultured Deefgea sp.]